VGAGGATAIFCMTLFMTTVLPTWSKRQDNQITDLTNQLSTARRALVESQKEAAARKRQADDVTKLANSLAAELRGERLSPIFVNSPYPRGTGDIRVGDSTKDLYAAFGLKPDDDEDRVFVVLKNSAFESAMFFKDKESSNKSIDYISYSLDSSADRSLPRNILLQQLTSVLGKPDASLGPNKKGEVQYCWKWKGLNISTNLRGMVISDGSSYFTGCEQG
jgi:hypothetical protein